MLGNRRNKTIGLVTRIPKAAELGGNAANTETVFENTTRLEEVFSIHRALSGIVVTLATRNHRLVGCRRSAMDKKLSLAQTVISAGVFSAVSFWYGFMFGRESARKELGGLIEDLRRSNAAASDATTKSSQD
ncbi:hypothetical protein GW17_00025740 [Ensete ventricosum]|nr:hypothetical protein GW17_00025740 [Ensete ventricosum]